MRGFVPTPAAIVDLMVAKLFAANLPSKASRLLDPGCGLGVLIVGVLRWCEQNNQPVPKIVGYETEPDRRRQAASRFRDLPEVEILEKDFLGECLGPFDYIIGNPPYVPITALSEEEKAEFRRRFLSARGRFDLYLLFFEQALRLLTPSGRLVFITPEKFLYVNTAEPLRRLLATHRVREIDFVSEETFGCLVTYPTITTVDGMATGRGLTAAVLRDRRRRNLVFPKDGSSLQPLFHGESTVEEDTGLTLGDICLRVSCGVATGLDSVFVQKTKGLEPGLTPFAFPTLAGRELSRDGSSLKSRESMLVPYDRQGRLLPLESLDALGSYLSRRPVRARLEMRTCARRKPWYAFHDSAPLPDILRPKLLCKDITAEPHFWTDRAGSIVPRHSVYYIVPRDSSKLDELEDYLNGAKAAAWLRANCQHAANDFLRLQSSVLKRLPLPLSFADTDPVESSDTDGNLSLSLQSVR